LIQREIALPTQSNRTSCVSFDFVLSILIRTGKKVAIFGVGDQESYGDNFCDAAGELYDLFQARGAKIYGYTSPEGYLHTASKAVLENEGLFCGLMCDEDNQYDLSEERAKKWVAQLKSEGFM
jgi:flavodoxin I